MQPKNNTGWWVLGIIAAGALYLSSRGPQPTPGPIPPGPPPDPSGSFLVVVTDNDHPTPAVADVIRSDDFRGWVLSKKIGYREIDCKGKVFAEAGYDKLLAADKVTPPCLVLWAPHNASHRSVAFPASIDACERWIAGTTDPGPPWIEVDGERRYLTCLPPSAAKYMAPRGGEFRDVHAPLPRSQWKEVDNRKKFPSSSWVYDQDGIGSCFPMGTLIRMADGSEKPIEQIRLLDKVLTAEGNISTVTQTMVRPENEGLLTLKLWGHSHLKLTKEHPVLTKRGYVPAGELLEDDWVAMPRYLPGLATNITTAEHIGINRLYVNQTRKRNLQSVLGRKPARMVYNKVPESISFTFGSGRILGLFLAEGNTDYGKTVFTFSAKEEKTLAAELIQLFKDEWGAIGVVQKRGNNSCKVNLYGILWAKLFESLCSTGAGSKKIHADLAGGSPEFLRGVLDGWLDGDGHTSARGREGKTISHELAIAMFDIAQGLGLRPSVLRAEPSMNEHAETRQPFWVVGLCSKTDNWRVEQDDKYTWRKVREVTREKWSGNVYNLEVEGDHSYVAEGIGVHNCVANGATAALRKARFLAGMSDVRLAPGNLYSQINGGQDQGAVISDSLTALQQTGVITSATLGSDEKPFYTRQQPSGWKKEAARFRIEEAYHCANFDDMATALQLGYVVVYGIQVGNNFNSFTADGVAGISSGPGNHCMCSEGLHKLPSGEWALDNVNSWGAAWGPWKNGRCYLVEQHFLGGDQPDAFAVKTAVEDPLDPIKPPKPPKGKVELLAPCGDASCRCGCADGDDCLCLAKAAAKKNDPPRSAEPIGARYEWFEHTGSVDQLDLAFGGRVIGAVLKSTGQYWSKDGADWRESVAPYPLPPGVAKPVVTVAPYQPLLPARYPVMQSYQSFGGGCASGTCR